MTDEDIVLDGHSLADKGVARDLAPFADLGVFLHLNKCSDLCLVPDFAAIEIDELRQFDIHAQLYICRYTDVRIAGVIAMREFNILHVACKSYSRKIVLLSGTERLAIL